MTPNHRVAELLVRWRQLRDAGKVISAEELCRDCPDLLPFVRERLNGASVAETATLAPAAPATSPPPNPSGSKTHADRGQSESSGSKTQAESRPVVREDALAEHARAIPGFEILGELGRGGMGVVYQARHLKLNRIVALKMILAGPHAAAKDLMRFLGEAEAVAQLQHPNIVQIFETGTHGGLPWFSLEYVEGGSLAEKVSEQSLSPREAAVLVEQIARGVQVAHDRGIIHRDLKPENVLLTPAGLPKVTDFGLAKKIEGGSGLTHTGALMGTPSYMAPEQVEGKKTVGLAADVWGLGAILYRLLTGRPPFQAATTLDTVVQVMCEEPVPPSRLLAKLPRDLETICLKCLQKEPLKRYANAAALADDLARFLKGEPIVARPVGRVERGIKWVRRNPIIAGATAVVLTTLLAGTTVSYIKYRDAETARKAEAERVRERNSALVNAENARAAEALRVAERDAALGKRNEALAAADARAKELTYQLGISDFLLAASAFDNRNARVAREHLQKVPMEQRKFEWHYLSRQVEGGIFTLRGHHAQVISVAFSLDGKRIVTGSVDSSAKVWDARSGDLLLDLTRHAGHVKAVAFSPDGTKLLSGSVKTLRIWDARTGDLLLKWNGHADYIHSASFSLDGRRIITGSYDRTAKVWDARSGALLLELKGFESGIASAAFSPDGTRIVIGTNSPVAQVRDAASGALLLELKGHAQGLGGVAFSPDGTRIATCGHDHVAKVWDARAGTLLVDLKGHVQGVKSIAFSPDGTRIVTSSFDNTAKVWDARAGTLLLDLKSHAGIVNCACFSPDGMRVATGSEDTTAKVWDARLGVPQLELIGHKLGIPGAVFSADGTRIVTAGWDEIAKVWDAKLGAPLLDLTGHDDPLECVAISPDGTRIVTGSRDKTAKVWDAKTGMHLFDLTGHTDDVRGVAFNRDGSRIATCGLDKTAKVWDAVHGTLLFDLKGHADEINGICFSPDGTRIATASDDDTAKIWNAQGGGLLLDLAEQGGASECVSFSPDGSKIVTGSSDKTARVWNARTGALQMELKGHTGVVVTAIFSPDGSRIVTCSFDKTAKVWDARTGTPLLDLKGYSGIGRTASFNPDGTRLVVGSDDKTATVLDGGPPTDFGALEDRIFGTRARVAKHWEDLAKAINNKDQFAIVFHLDRLLAYLPDERKSLLITRNRYRVDPALRPRMAFHRLNINERPTWYSIALLAASGNRLTARLAAQCFLVDDKPGPALPLLHLSLLGRRSNQPPVEEFLIAQALLDLNKHDEAMRYYLAAVEWLDKAQRPLWACDLVAAGFSSPWQALANLAGPYGDPRYNEFDWESWRECEVFRARVEKKMR